MFAYTSRVLGLMITRFTAHGKTFSRSRLAESERFTALNNRCGCLRRLSFRSVDLIPSENLHRTDAAIWIRLHAPMRIPRPNISLAGRKNERCIRTGTVSFTCMRTIPRDDTVTNVRFYAARCRYWGRFNFAVIFICLVRYRKYVTVSATSGLVEEKKLWQ